MKIAEVSERYGLPTATLRNYEPIGLLPPVNRAASGNLVLAGHWYLRRGQLTPP